MNQKLYFAKGPKEELPPPSRVAAIRNILKRSEHVYVADQVSPREFFCIYRKGSRLSQIDRKALNEIEEDFDAFGIYEVVKSSFRARRLLPEHGGYFWIRIPIPDRFSEEDKLYEYLREEDRIGHTVITENKLLYSRAYLPRDTLEDLMIGFWEIFGYEVPRSQFYVVYGKGKSLTLPRTRRDSSNNYLQKMHA